MKDKNPFFQEEIDLIDAKINEYLIRFTNWWFEKLIERWCGHYFERQNEYTTEEEFKNHLREMIWTYIRYLTIEKDEPLDWTKSDRIRWIREKYKELLYEELYGNTAKKQEALVEQIGAKGKVLKLLDWARWK